MDIGSKVNQLGSPESDPLFPSVTVKVKKSPSGSVMTVLGWPHVCRSSLWRKVICVESTLCDLV